MIYLEKIIIDSSVWYYYVQRYVKMYVLLIIVHSIDKYYATTII